MIEDNSSSAALAVAVVVQIRGVAFVVIAATVIVVVVVVVDIVVRGFARVKARGAAILRLGCLSSPQQRRIALIQTLKNSDREMKKKKKREMDLNLSGRKKNS